MPFEIWLNRLPRPLRRLISAGARLCLVVVEPLVAWMVRRATAPTAHGIKLVSLAVANGTLHAERLRGALDLLAERAPRVLCQVQKHVAAVVVMPDRIRPRHRFWRGARVVMLDQVIVWRWSPEALAVELAGWAVDGRLQAAGFGSESYRERRERRVLLEKIWLGGGASLPVAGQRKR
jgi:hypothetical protein